MNFLMKLFNMSKSLEVDTKLDNFVELNDNVDEHILNIVKIMKYSDVQDDLESNKTHSEILALLFSCMSAILGLLAIFDSTNGILYSGRFVYALLANIFIAQRIRSNDKIEYVVDKKEETYHKIGNR